MKFETCANKWEASSSRHTVATPHPRNYSKRGLTIKICTATGKYGTVVDTLLLLFGVR